MEIRELICIGCPLGCLVNVELMEGKIENISGYTCKRGEAYAKKEVTNPTRMVTSTVKVINGEKQLVSVKTKTDIPKNKIFECMEQISQVQVEAPIAIGDVILNNVAGTSVDIVATKNVKKQ
jgi:CxxC motif-containing protein